MPALAAAVRRITMLEEPLAESASLAARVAVRLCRRDPASGKSCAWLHGFWQYLRLMEMAAAPERHADFYAAAFAMVDGAGAPPRVLVSGAADYAMLAQVLAAFRARGIAPQLTVVDRCDTPLFLNRWYAERVSARIATHCADAREFAAPRPFDLICTHSFLGQFAREERPQLVAAWRRLLRPGGHAVTVNPLRASGPDAPNRFTAEQARAFLGTVRAQASRLRDLTGADPRTLFVQAERYLEARYGYPVRSAEEVRELFEAGGFCIEHMVCTPAPAGGCETGGPGLRVKGATYVNLIARRL